ncbi:MAG: hypothetical protein GY705_16355 [Bacteroidetes bacterium]|nr:hypothetical protein [Bacteroidota bacterium]
MIIKIFFFIWLCLLVFLSVSPNTHGDQSVLSKIALTKSGFFMHTFGYFVLGAITFFTFEKRRIWLYLLGILLLGVMLEVVQCFISTRTFNVFDLLGNTIGVLCIGVIIFFKERMLPS